MSQLSVCFKSALPGHSQWFRNKVSSSETKRKLLLQGMQ
jgi:hypothetical protein